MEGKSILQKVQTKLKPRAMLSHRKGLEGKGRSEVSVTLPSALEGADLAGAGPRTTLSSGEPRNCFLLFFRQAASPANRRTSR